MAPTAYVESLFKIGMVSPIDPREVVFGVGDGFAIIEPKPYDDHVYLTAFRVTAQGKGIGGAVMKTLTDLADEHGVTLRLVARPLDVHAPLKKTPKARLIAFYKRHGFKPDPVYTASSGHMVRTPQ